MKHGSNFDLFSSERARTDCACGHKVTFRFTVWKFHDFCITQILREINLEDFRSAKTAVFPILMAVEIVHLVNFIKIQHQSLKMC